MNQQNLADFIWSVADVLRGDFKQPVPGRIIPALTALRRLKCVREPTRDSAGTRYQALNMLKHLTAGLAIALALVGCQTQQQYQQESYKTYCLPSAPQNQCVDSTRARSGQCEIERSVVARCAQFVTNEVNYKLARGDTPPSSPVSVPRYSATDPTPIIVEVNVDDDRGERWMAGDDLEWRVPVDPSNPKDYLHAAVKVERLANYMLGAHEKTVRFYLQGYGSKSSIPRTSVYKRITRLEKLRGPLNKAVAAGEAMTAFYNNPANQPKAAFDVLADELVDHINPHDPILRKAADAAIQQRRLGGTHNELADQARLGLIKFRFAQSIANQPLEQTFLTHEAKHLKALKEQREWDDWAQRNTEQQRQISSPSSGRRAQGGHCSCAGRNVCYGPRGGRYCITSGGNKRYGI